MKFLGLDVGGANLKGASSDGWHASRTFPLWRQPELLSQALCELIDQATTAGRIAATMTGELADCFRTKRQGVTFIIHALREAAGERPLSIYLTDGRLVSPQVALEHPLLAAASNWHALAHHVAQSCEIDCGLLVDLGSTTCDIIPLIDMRVAAHGSTDTERLIHGELVYTGVVRSPVCAVTAALPYRGNRCPVAQELFATTLDAYLVLRHIDEDPADLQTADGRPATRENARARLARTICADAEHFDDEDARSAAEAIKNSQIVRIEESLARVCGRLPAAPRTIVVSGQGEFLLREMLTCRRRSPEFGDAQVLSLSERLGEGLSRVAPAYALARLAQRSEP